MLNIKRKWHPSVAIWFPNPKNRLHIDKSSLTETKRFALQLRRSIVDNEINRIKVGLLGLELNHLAETQTETTQEILRDLDILEQVTTQMTQDIQPQKPSTPISPTIDKQKPTIQSQNQKQDLMITISPDGPTFTVTSDFRTEFLSGLYHRQSQWLPSFGHWYQDMTDNAMQRRVFPKELKGNLNFQNSTSLKLISSVLDTLASVTEDIYTDIRHLSDINAALCLINGYYCLKTGYQIPTTYSDLLHDLDKKIVLLATDLKQENSSTDFSFVISNPNQFETIAPLNKQGTYAADFFSSHKIFLLMAANGMFPHSKNKPMGGDPLNRDIVYLITNNVFSQDIPPFMTHQWNLRVGLKALEIFIVVYIILENAHISGNTISRRLQLATLLADQYKPQKLNQVFKRGYLFSFLLTNYVIPCLTHFSNTPASSLFPGVIQLALESVNTKLLNVSSNQLINLSGKKYDGIFQILNQKLVFKDIHALIQAQTALRLTVEEGLNLILSKGAPLMSISNIMTTQFGGGDDYDTLYFLVLGCLPVTLPVV
nr:homolog of EHV2 ORF19 DNA packaging tegument protein UL25 [Macronycteris gammaherpesvirus 1]